MEASAVPRLAPVGVPGARSPRFLRLASDAHLIALIREGRGAAFDAVYDRHHRGILSFCRHTLGDAQEAEDAVQHTFLAAYNDLISSKKQVHLRAWLFAIARNRCYSILRARREHPAAELDEAVTEGLATQVQRREDFRDLVGDMQSLPDDQRAALVLAELESLSHEQIGEALGVPREKVKALVFQARESLVASRAARETDCAEIREQLATQRGGALRRSNLRRHLRECEGCREFRKGIERQRRQLAMLLPVVPTAALKQGVLAGAIAGRATAGLVGSLVFSSALKSGGLKVIVGVAIAGVGTAGTIVATQDPHFDGATAPPPTVTGAPEPRLQKVLPAATTPAPPEASAGSQVRPSGAPQVTAPAAGPGNRVELSKGSPLPTGGVSFSITAAAATLRSLIQGTVRAVHTFAPVPGRLTGGAPLSLPPAEPPSTIPSPASGSSGAQTGTGTPSWPVLSSSAPTGQTGNGPKGRSSGSSTSTPRPGSHGGNGGGYGGSTGSTGSTGRSIFSGGSTRGENSANGSDSSGSTPTDGASGSSGSSSGGGGSGGTSGVDLSGVGSGASGGSGGFAGSGGSSGSENSTTSGGGDGSGGGQYSGGGSGPGSGGSGLGTYGVADTSSPAGSGTTASGTSGAAGDGGTAGTGTTTVSGTTNSTTMSTSAPTTTDH